jgi:AraC family transcriptional regulator of adaptative response / DNA-3-methyladenine glycosylase II
VLIETTDLPITEVAFAAGFASVRQFNDTVREVFAATPSQLRAARSPGAPGRDGAAHARRAHPPRHDSADGARRNALAVELGLLLPCRQPFDAGEALAFLGRRAVAGVEAWDGQVYARSLRLARGAGVAALSGGPRPGSVRCSLWLDDLADAQSAVQRCRRMLDLDSDPSVVDARLGADPILAPLVDVRPGLRSPGHPDGAELLARAILGQQVSVDRARALAEGLVAAAGEALARPRGGVTMLFPSAAAIAALDPATLPMPSARSRALTAASAELAAGRLVLDAGSDRGAARAALLALPGIGPWTADYVALRALGDPDAFLPTDGGARRAAAALGLDPSPRALARRAEAWRPWRAYALHHLWASLQGDPR